MANKPYNRQTEGCLLVSDLSIDGAAHKTLRVNITSVGTSETDTRRDLPAKCVVHDVALVVITPSTGATKTLNVGLLASSSGDADGFAVGLSVASSGVVVPAVQTSTSGTAGRFVTGATYGFLLAVVTSGSTVAADNGLFARKVHSVNTLPARSITVTPNSSEWVNFKAVLLIDYTELD